MRRFLHGLLVVCLAGCIQTAAAFGWEGEYEALHFDIRWLFIPAGVAIIQARSPAPDHAHFRLEACSNSTVDLFYKVRDLIRVDSLFRAHELQPQLYRYQQREGSHHSDLTLDFEAGDSVTVTDHETDTTQTYPIPTEALDMVSAFFTTRSLPLESGKSYRMPVFDKDKYYVLTVEVMGRERRDTILGEDTPTIRIHPKLQSEGIFKRSGEMYLWLTDDDRHLPVRMESKVKFGKVISELTHIYTRAPENQYQGMLCEQYRDPE